MTEIFLGLVLLFVTHTTAPSRTLSLHCVLSITHNKKDRINPLVGGGYIASIAQNKKERIVRICFCCLYLVLCHTHITTTCKCRLHFICRRVGFPTPKRTVWNTTWSDYFWVFCIFRKLFDLSPTIRKKDQHEFIFLARSGFLSHTQ